MSPPTPEDVGGPDPGMSGRSDRDAGWRRDPTGRFQERFLLAGSWTRRVRWDGAEAVDLQSVDAEGPPPSDWQRRADVDPADQGWRDDPAGRFPERWWDGRSFTRKIRVGQAVATDTVAPPRSPGESGGRRRVAAGGPAEPGWADDPSGEGQRYWDGYQWTAKWRAGPSSPADHSMRGWWSQTVLMAAAGLVVLLVVVALVVVVVVLL